MNFEESIKPFFWVKNKDNASLCLDVGDYKSNIFAVRKDEGFEGNGFDWQSLAVAYLEKREVPLSGVIDFDSEGDMFCVYSSNIETLKTFALEFKAICDDEEKMLSLFMTAELD